MSLHRTDFAGGSLELGLECSELLQVPTIPSQDWEQVPFIFCKLNSKNSRVELNVNISFHIIRNPFRMSQDWEQVPFIFCKLNSKNSRVELNVNISFHIIRNPFRMSQVSPELRDSKATGPGEM
ncbi:hypothetical protein HGM15179_014121 [Zosterops borbonicus]|uniref:Uncharacterized protein n=1 Tax=Zosterops borbonicus TaxID=364589 RepID=A0A8K1G7H8_9PASS|nr:hypothetical protein HGM15179_014121 [Zosterops borbonicus]